MPMKIDGVTLPLSALRQLAVASDGQLLWLLTATAVGERTSLKADELPGEISLWTLPDLRRVATLALPPIAWPFLAAVTPTTVVLASSKGAQHLCLRGDRIVLDQAIGEAELMADEQPRWLAQAPFANGPSLLVGVPSGRNQSANGRWIVEVSDPDGGGLLGQVRDAQSGVLRGQVRFAQWALGAAAVGVDDTGSVVLVVLGRDIVRWDVDSSAAPRVLPDPAPSEDCCLVLAVAADCFALFGDWYAVYRLSTGVRCSLEMVQVGQHVGVSAAMSRGVRVEGNRLTVFDPVPRAPGGASEVATIVRAAAQLVAFFDGAIAVCVDGDPGSTVRVFDGATARPIAEVEVPAKLTELRARPHGAGLIAVAASGELYAIEGARAPRVRRWDTGRIYSQGVTVCAATGVVAVGHGLLTGRGKSYAGNLQRATADGMTVWSADGAVRVDAQALPMPQSVAIDGAAGLVRVHSGTLITSYRSADFPALRPVGRAVMYPLDWVYEFPSPTLLPHGRGVLTCEAGQLVVFDLVRGVTMPIVAAPGVKLLAISGDGCRILVHHAAAGELACYDTTAPSRCLARWRSPGPGVAALSLDGSAAIVTGGDALFEVVEISG